MKMRALTTLFALLIVQTTWSQYSNWSERVHALRADFLELTPEHAPVLKGIYLNADSLYGSQVVFYKAQLDSLSNDSLTNTLHHVGAALDIELFAFYSSKGATKEADAAMMSLQTRLMKIGNQDELTLALHRLIVDYFVSTGNWAGAYTSEHEHVHIQRALHGLELGAMEAQMADRQTEMEQTSQALAQSEEKRALYDQLLPWTVGVVGVLFLLLVIVWIRSVQLKRKFNDLRQRFQDQHIAVDETQKLSVQYKNEGAQFKQTVEAAITKLNDIEAAKVHAYKELSQWKEESSEDLVQLKELVETLKDAPSVTTYMQIQNQVARLQSKNREKLHALSDLLKK